jgi:P-type Ca2+ transporter type 2C
MQQTAFPLNETQGRVGRRHEQGSKALRQWHTLEASFVTQLLDVDPSQGLAASEVLTRRLRYGSNSSETLRSQRITGILVLLILSTAIGFLLTAAILNRAAGDGVEAFSVLVVVVIGAIFGFSYVLKAASAIDAMQDATKAPAQVRREGQETKIKATELVPGDIVTLSAGDYVPADARLIETVQLQVLESALTGKRSVVEKQTSLVVKDAPLGERQSMVYLGTTIGFGSGVAVVVATGAETELGKIATWGN